MKQFILYLLISIPMLFQAQVKKIIHVILIGVDGLGANYLAHTSSIPFMKMKMVEGS